MATARSKLDRTGPVAALETKEPVGNPAVATPTAAEEKAPAVWRKKSKKKPKGNAPAFDLAGQLTRMAGVDLTRINGIDVMTAQTVMAEVGNVSHAQVWERIRRETQGLLRAEVPPARGDPATEKSP